MTHIDKIASWGDPLVMISKMLSTVALAIAIGFLLWNRHDSLSRFGFRLAFAFCLTLAHLLFASRFERDIAVFLFSVIYPEKRVGYLFSWPAPSFGAAVAVITGTVIWFWSTHKRKQKAGNKPNHQRQE
jgi:hypothetical protein